METSSTSDTSRARSIRVVAISACVSAIGFPFAATASVPTAVGYVALPGVIIFTLMALCSVVCFLLCPLRPLILKLIAFALTVNTVFWFLYSTGYYWLHLVYHA
jgi:hypothetical protein